MKTPIEPSEIAAQYAISTTCHCGKDVLARGLCSAHYSAARLADTLPPSTVPEQRGLFRFWSNVLPSRVTDCWQWQGSLTHQGYGQFTFLGRNVRAHRFAYEQLVGGIPEGLVLDHLCRNRACVNPKHLEPVTNRENVLRGIGPSAEASRRNTCAKGHQYTEANTRMERGRRICRECEKLKMRGRRLAAVDHANGTDR